MDSRAHIGRVEPVHTKVVHVYQRSDHLLWAVLVVTAVLTLLALAVASIDWGGELARSQTIDSVTTEALTVGATTTRWIARGQADSAVGAFPLVTTIAFPLSTVSATAPTVPAVFVTPIVPAAAPAVTASVRSVTNASCEVVLHAAAGETETELTTPLKLQYLAIA